MPNWKKLIVSGSDAVLNSLSVNTNVTATSFTGSLSGTSSFATTASYVTGSIFTNSNSAASASYAATASYVTASNVYGPYGSNSIISASYANYALTASNSQNAQDILIYVKNTSGAQINKGKVVRISGSTGDNALISTASYTNDSNSANTLGITNENIANDAFGYVITEGKLLGIDTSAFVAGQLLYLGATGSIIGTAPVAPLHAVRLGQVLRVQLNNGSMYVRVDNGYELGELHDVVDSTTTSSYGDLLVKSGSVWINSKQLTGSYSLTGSLQATSFTGSLQGTSSWAINALTASNIGPSISPDGSNRVLISNGNGTMYTTSSLIYTGSTFTVIGGLSNGQNTTTSGSYSHAEGNTTISYGDYSHAEGDSTNANGYGSHTEGLSTTSNGDYSHAEGAYTVANGDYSHAEGNGAIANGDYSHAEGSETTAAGSYTHAEGDTTVSSGSYSHAEGSITQAIGNASHAEGSSTTAYGDYSHAEGFSTISSGSYSHAEGGNTLTRGEYSHAEGFTTIANGDYSHAEGAYTISTGPNSHTEGASTTATGLGSHAEGHYTTASGDFSHAEGLGTITSASYQHAQGMYNIASAVSGAFILGNGTSNVSRSNLIFAVNNTVQITGSLNVSGNVTASALYAPNGNIDSFTSTDITVSNINTSTINVSDLLSYDSMTSLRNFATIGSGSTLNLISYPANQYFGVVVDGIAYDGADSAIFRCTVANTLAKVGIPNIEILSSTDTFGTAFSTKVDINGGISGGDIKITIVNNLPNPIYIRPMYRLIKQCITN